MRATRPTSSCPHRPPCPGCPRFGEPGIAHTPLAALTDLACNHGLPEVRVVNGQTTGFRHRARLAIRGRVGSPKLGLFELDTHHVVHIPNCSVQHPLINHVASVVRRALVDTRTTAYSDSAHLGLARYLQVVVERSSQTAQVVLVGNCETAEPLSECLDLIRDRLGERLHSLWFNANCAHANTILGQRFEHWHGPASVTERFGGATVHYPPGAFGQSNLEIAETIIERVRATIPQGARVAEFYAGVGAIGLSMLERAGEIRLNEVSPQSLHGLELGIGALAAADRARVSVTAGPAGTAHDMASGMDVVIADPPRKGLDHELTAQLQSHPPQRFVYVSCGLESFLNDCAQLVARKALRLAHLEAFNLFPFTEHVETVAVFERG